jgi:hypothetical protein
MGLMAAAIGGCGPRPKVRLDLVTKGMTVSQVEAILGKPIEVMDLGPSPPLRPGGQLRIYRGDGDHRINVVYHDGIVDHFYDRPPRPWLKVGALLRQPKPPIEPITASSASPL